MKLLILTSEFPPGPGGIGTHAFQLAQHLSKAGVIVRVIANQDYASLDEIKLFNTKQPFAVISNSVRTNRIFKGIFRVNQLCTEIKHFDPDLVLATGTRSAWICSIVMRSIKKPWCAVGHGTEFGSRKGLNAFISRYAYNKAREIICVSEYTRKQVYGMGILNPILTVINNGADEECFYKLQSNEVANIRRNIGTEGKFILLTVGSLSDRKGQEIVIRALPAIRQVVPNVEYWMVGMPFKKPEFEDIAKDLGIKEHIRIWGRVENNQLNDLYNASDLFVMTSRRMQDGDFEGYGIAVMEAALCGVPAVVTKGSGLEEAVIDGQTGLLVDQNDPVATAGAIIRLTKDDILRNLMGEKAYERTRNWFTWQQVTNKYLERFNKIIENYGAEH